MKLYFLIEKILCLLKLGFAFYIRCLIDNKIYSNEGLVHERHIQCSVQNAPFRLLLYLLFPISAISWKGEIQEKTSSNDLITRYHSAVSMIPYVTFSSFLWVYLMI